MSPGPTDRDRWLALGLLLAAIALAYFVLLHPWWTEPLLDTESRIEALQERALNEAAAYYGQNGDAMLRVARCESNLDPYNVTPPYEASGLFQFLPGTWATTPYADENIFDPEINAYAAAWMWSVGRRNEWVCQ